ncbi:E3 ubiquitin-protein ligase CHFR-like isoform X2 [Ptychodera flava]
MKTRVSKGQRVEINHGDEIHIVLFKDQEEKNVAYLFQDLAILELEMMEETLEYGDEKSSDTETQEYNVSEDMETSVSVKRSHTKDEDIVEEPAMKKTKSDSEEMDTKPGTSGTCSKSQIVKTAPEEKNVTQDDGQETKTNKEQDVAEKEKDGDLEKENAAAERKAKAIEADCSEMDKQTGGIPVAKETDRVLRGAGDYGKDVERDEMEEALLCGICQDMLHDCISLQPCMHSFCAACYSPWMEQSNECPSCRNRVTRLSRNHIVNNLVEAYLKEHPEKRRSDEEIRELNAQNKITDDMLQPKVRGRGSYDYYDDDDDEEDEDADNDNDDHYDVPTTGFGVRIVQAVGGLFGLGVARPPPTICRQCPGNVNMTAAATTTANTTTVTTASTSTTTVPAEPSTSDSKSVAAADSTTADSCKASTSDPQPSTSTAVEGARPSTSSDSTGTSTIPTNTRTTPDGETVTMPDPPEYTCIQGQVHLMCLCCKQAMPDRRAGAVVNPDIPVQQCDICYRGYCHMYWGCKRVDCYGCLNYFRDMNFGRKSLISVVNDNPYESEIFRNYMEDNNLTVKDVLRECLVRLDRGEYVTTDAHNFRGQKGSDVRICYPCGLRNFKELAYQFRRDIPRSELPASVTSRPDCYWGKNCRTQRSRPHHAGRFNHICEQTRHEDIVTTNPESQLMQDVSDTLLDYDLYLDAWIEYKAFCVI